MARTVARPRERRRGDRPRTIRKVTAAAVRADERSGKLVGACEKASVCVAVDCDAALSQAVPVGAVHKAANLGTSGEAPVRPREAVGGMTGC